LRRVRRIQNGGVCVDVHHMRWNSIWHALRAPVRHVGWKIMGPFVLLTIVVGVAGSWLATRNVTESLEARFTNQLLESAHVATDTVVRREQAHLEVLRAVAFTQGVGAATESRDQAALERLVAPIAANAGIGRVEVLGTDGRVLFATGTAVDSAEGDRVAATRSDWSAVTSALSGQADGRGDKFAQLGSTPDGLILVSVGPILDGDQIVGAVLVGTLLEPFLAAAELEILADITVYDFDGTVLATTFPPFQEGSENLGTAGAAVFAAASDGTLVQRDTFAGRDYRYMYGELAIRGDIVGLFSVALPEEFILAAGAATRLQMGVLFGGFTALVLLVGWWLTRKFTRPLGKLNATARAVSSGDLSARSGVRGDDEIGQLAVSFDAMTARAERQHLGTVRALATAIDARDPYTLGHSVRVGQLAVEIGRKMEAPSVLLKHLEVGGYLHDVGKIGIRDHVLLKPGGLTPDERALVERHPTIGLDILKYVDLPQEVTEFVAGHHEKLDGTGYPLGLTADEIGIIPRIAAVADIYDALSTERPYKRALSLEEAVGILRREAKGGQLDPLVVRAFEDIAQPWRQRVAEDPTLQSHDPLLGRPAMGFETLRARLRSNRPA
jgi:putative nucleotidyltransferase with HDIG domain